MTSTRTILWSRAAAGALLTIATLLGGVAVAPAEPAFRFEKAACPEMPAPIPELETARCGQLTVPENRDKPNGRTITLSVAIIPAASANPKPDPIVWLAGGPGDDAITEIPMALAGDLNRDRDVIFMSQRGTYSAKPSLTCDEVDRVPGGDARHGRLTRPKPGRPMRRRPRNAGIGSRRSASTLAPITRSRAVSN